MVESEEPEKNKQKKQPGNIDPAVEAKVDKMMMSDAGRAAQAGNKPGVPEEGSSTAPLLPGEELPDFNKRKPPDTQSAANERESKDNPGQEEASLQTTGPEARKLAANTVNNPATEKAVDEIVEEESDRMLAMEDAKAQLLAEGMAEIDRGFSSRLKSAVAAFWHNKWARYSFIFIILAAIAAAAAMPTSRYWLLNKFGARASISLRVIDNKTDQPLREVQVSIDNSTGQTDKDGNIKLEDIKLGDEELTVRKPAFADFSEQVTLGWGSNPIGDVALTPVGSRYKFEVKDYVSNKALATAEATSGEANARADKNGEIVLVVADQNETKVNIKISAPGYRPVKVSLEAGDKQARSINLVPAKLHAFVSKQSGTYDLYKAGVDGKNEQMILAGTGNENENDMFLLPNPDNSLVAFVSTRGDHHGQDGSVLSDLMVVSLSDNSVDNVDYSQSIQLLGFTDSKLIYVKIDESQDADSAKRQALIAYDTNTHEQKVLARANYFNDAILANNVVYYAPAEYKKGAKTGLYSINPDGGNLSNIYSKETWNLFRVSYDKLDAAIDQNWYEYDIATAAFNALSGAPPDQQSRIYTTSPDGQKSAWVDERDGKGVLLIYDVATGQDTVLYTQSGLSNPVSWLDAAHLVYRVSTSSETADYVISLNGGGPKKIRDVTNTADLGSWYY